MKTAYKPVVKLAAAAAAAFFAVSSIQVPVTADMDFRLYLTL